MGVSQPDPITGHPKRRNDYKRIKAQFKALIYGESRFCRNGNQISKPPAGFAAGVSVDGMQQLYGTSPLGRVLTATIFKQNVA